MKLVTLVLLTRIHGNTIFDSGPMTSFEHNTLDYRNLSKPNLVFKQYLGTTSSKQRKNWYTHLVSAV